MSFPGEATKKTERWAPRVEPSPEPRTEPRAKPQPKPWPLDRRLSNASRPRNRQQRVTPKGYNQARAAAVVAVTRSLVSSLANMLAVEAAMHMGLIQSPGEEPPPPDLEAARHLIDMLGILRPKSRQPHSEEDNLLENMLADLRMRCSDFQAAMRITFLDGTSVGVPSVGCECTTCLSVDPRDKRLRDLGADRT